MAVPPTAPTPIVATVISSTRVDITWANTGYYDQVDVWRKVGAGDYAWYRTLPGSSEYMEDSGCAPEIQYCYQARGIRYYPYGESDFSAENGNCGTAFPTLYAPTDIVATAISDTEIDVVFKDNSNAETNHRLERKVVGNGGWVHVVDLEPNREFYRDSGLVKGESYTYQVRAEGPGGPSAYIESDQVTTISEPAIPTLAAILDADTQDKSIRIRWTDVANETGYRIEQDTDEIAVVGAGVTDFLVTGLTPGVSYDFRIRAYNAAGNSNYSDVRTKITLTAYVPTEFEKWIRNPNIEPVYLAEIYIKMDLTGFEEHDGACYKKEIEASDRGIDILEVFENGTAYTLVGDPDAVKTTASTFWFDYNNRMLYVHTSDGTNPNLAKFLIEGAFWLYFSTHKDIEFNNNFYLPLLTKEDIPDITQEIKSYFEGSFLISSGSIAFMNGKIRGEHFFDKKYATYTWENGKLVLKAGRDDFAYADFKTILTSFIDQKSCNDRRVTFTLRDLRQGMERNLELNKFWKNDQGDGRAWYPNIEDDFVGEPIPLCFGTKFGVTPIPIDVYNKKYKFHDGRSKLIIEVRKDDAVLTEDTDYFVDLQRSIITFATGYAIGEEDIVEVDFIGSVNSANDPIVNGADIFKYLMNNHYELSNSELDLDSIYRAKREKTAELAMFLYKNTPYREIVRAIEHSMEAYTFQDTEGRLGLKAQLAAAESDAKYIGNHQVFAHQQSRARSSLFWKVNVWYNEKPQSQEWDVKWAQDDAIWYRYKNRNILNVYSYFSCPYNAQTLATSILTLLNKETINDTLPMLLFDVMAGDIIKFSRDRFYNADGRVAAGSEISLRIIRISKSPASGQTTIIGEIV